MLERAAGVDLQPGDALGYPGFVLNAKDPEWFSSLIREDIVRAAIQQLEAHDLDASVFGLDLSAPPSPRASRSRTARA